MIAILLSTLLVANRRMPFVLPNAREVWFLTRPGDTTQVENETPEYLLAHYARSAIEASKILPDEPEPRPQFDALYVHKHMIKRARECPLAMIVLMELMVTQAILAMKGANRTCAIRW